MRISVKLPYTIGKYRKFSEKITKKPLQKMKKSGAKIQAFHFIFSSLFLFHGKCLVMFYDFTLIIYAKLKKSRHFYIRFSRLSGDKIFFLFFGSLWEYQWKSVKFNFKLWIKWSFWRSFRIGNRKVLAENCEKPRYKFQIGSENSSLLDYLFAVIVFWIYGI